jgi:hypothetical protein
VNAHKAQAAALVRLYSAAARSSLIARNSVPDGLPTFGVGERQ